MRHLLQTVVRAREAADETDRLLFDGGVGMFLCALIMPITSWVIDIFGLQDTPRLDFGMWALLFLYTVGLFASRHTLRQAWGGLGRTLRGRPNDLRDGADAVTLVGYAVAAFAVVFVADTSQVGTGDFRLPVTLAASLPVILKAVWDSFRWKQR